MFAAQPPEISRAALAWTHKRGSIGRMRAARILRRLVPARPAGTLGESMLWTYLRADGSLIQNPRDPGQAQPAVTVNYLVLRAGEFVTGVWTLEVPDHALVRLIQRLPGVDLASMLFAGHAALLAAAAPPDRLPRDNETLLVPTPSGAFAVNLIFGREQDTGDLRVYARARTWLHDDQLQTNQRPIAPGSPTLGETLLVPAPLRTMTCVGDRLRMETI